jgi:peptidyl-prolyl cis-trans isomerase C
MMVKEFDEVVFSAPVGSLQGPVKTQFGFHLLEVTARD